MFSTILSKVGFMLTHFNIHAKIKNLLLISKRVSWS